MLKPWAANLRVQETVQVLRFWQLAEEEQFRVYELRSTCLAISPLLSSLFSLGQFRPHLLGIGIVCVHHHKFELKLSERQNCLLRVIYETFSFCVLT